MARSSTEAEYRSLANVTAELTWLQSLLTELKVPTAQHSPLVYCDNISAVQLAHNPVLHHRTKHIELDLFFVRDKVLQKKIKVTYVPSADQIVDIFTKPLSSARFHTLKTKLKVFDVNPP